MTLVKHPRTLEEALAALKTFDPATDAVVLTPAFGVDLIERVLCLEALLQ